MANGLRKLIRKARRFSNPLMTNRRVRKFGTRLKVEELEERIAPAAVTLTPGDFTTYDITGGTDGVHDVTDGVFGLSGAAGSDNDLATTVTDIDVTILDDTTPVITDIDFGALTATETVVIATNRTIGDLDLGNLTTAFDTTTITTLNLVIIAGNNAADGAAANELMFNDVSGSDTDYSFDTYTAGTGDDPTDAEVFTGLTTGSVGTITLPTSVHASGLTVNLVVVAGATGTITSITSTATDVTLSSVATTNLAGSVVNAGTITAFSWTGPIDPGAVDVWLDADSNAGSGIGALTLGTVTLDTANGDLVIDSDGGIGATSIGVVTATADGDLLIDADDDGGNDDGFTGTVVLGGIDIDVAGAAVSIDGGGSGFGSTVSLGAIDLATAADQAVSITTSSTGGFGDVVSATTITNNSTAGGSVTIGPAGAGDLAGFTATGLISNAAAAVNGGITIGGGTSTAVGNISLAGITLASTNAGGDITFQGESLGIINSSAAIQTSAGALGAILFDANGAVVTGSMGNIIVTGNIAAGASTISFQANDDFGLIQVTGNVGGAGTISFTANHAGGTADTGNIGFITVTNATGTAQLGNGAGSVSFSAVDISDIVADDIGSTGAGAVSFTANGLDATDGAGGGVIGTLTVTDDVAATANVTFTADDGMGVVTIGGDAAQANGVTLRFDVNQDGEDDTGSMATISAQSLGNAAGTGNVVIDTNSAATDNTTLRTVGAITITDGNGKLSITAAGDVGLITVTGNSGTGNDLDIDLLNLDAAGDGANADIPDFAGINIVDTADADTLTLGGAWTIPGIIGVGGSPATPGSIIVGGGDATDVMALGGNDIDIYAGDDVADGFDAAFAPSSPNDPSVVSITAGDITSAGGVITANTKAASDLFTYVEAGETFAISTASDVTANIAFTPGATNSVSITELAGTSASDDLSVTTSGSSDFDVSAITPAAAGLDVRNITIEGNLTGNIGTAALSFGAVNTIIIQGADNGNQFFGDSLKGYASTDSTLVLTGVDILTLDTAADGSEDLVLIAGSTFNFADAAGAAPGVDAFNHHIGVIDDVGVAGIGTATVRGVDGAGDSTADPLYLFSGNGSSTAQAGATNEIDPNDLISGSALVSRIMLNDVGGLETDAAVREVDGTTEGSFFEFETSVGLVNLTTQLDSISVGIDDNADLVDNAVSTSLSGGSNTRSDFARLGGGETGSSKSGLNPATSVSDGTAALGNLIVQSMGQSAGISNNINVVVTGNSGPITLTGDTDLTTPDHGDIDVDDGTTAAAIAIGGNLEGALTIPGEIDQSSSGEADILIGIAVDVNNDGDWLDTDETPSGSVNAAITIGDAGDTDILVADNVTADIVITGADQDLEAPGLELDGDLNGVKAGGDLGDLGEDVVVVARHVNYVIADGALNSGIFAGGDEDWVIIEGTGINGPGVLGATEGVYSVDFIDHEVFGDVGDYDWIETDYAMTVQWAAGAFTDTLDVIGDVYMMDDSNYYLEVGTNSGDAMNIGDIFQLEDVDFDVESPADIGVIVVAEGVNILTSEQLQDLITTTYDVVNSPTRLDTANGDDDDQLEFDGSISAANAGGVIAESDIDLSADIDGDFGDIISLNGEIYNSYVTAGESIGSIVASSDIDGDFYSEGTLAVGTVIDVSTYGLSGVPSWFTGGVLTEVGDITYGSAFRADGESEVVGGVVVSTGVDTMGTFYVLAGNMGLNTANTVEIFCYGNFGGIQVGAGNAWLYIKVVGGEIDTMIAPYYYQTGYSIRPEANIEATSGEKIVSANNSYALGNVAVSVSSGVIGFVDPGDNTHIDDLMLLNLGSGTSVSVTGDVDTLSVEGNWGGTVTVSGSALGETDGVVDTVSVDGNVESTAVLTAANFQELLVTGTIDSNVTGSGTLTSSNPSDPVPMAGSTVATIFLDGTSNVEAAWTSVFGKVMTVDVSGRGKADLVLAEGTVSDAALEDIASAGEVGDGGANLGELTAATTVRLDDVVIQGSADDITARQINDLWISGGAGTIIANKINAANIGDDLDMLTVQKAKNFTVDGDVDTIHAYKLQSVTILGYTDNLYMTGTRAGHAKGQILNSIFGEGVGYQNFNLDDRFDHVKVRNTTGLY